MPAAIVNSDGLVTIPRDVVRALGLSAGDRVDFVQVESAQFLLLAANRSVTDLKGMFGKADRAVSTTNRSLLTI